MDKVTLEALAALDELEARLLASLRDVRLDPWVRAPIEESVRAGFERERAAVIGNRGRH